MTVKDALILLIIVHRGKAYQRNLLNFEEETQRLLLSTNLLIKILILGLRWLNKCARIFFSFVIEPIFSGVELGEGSFIIPFSLLVVDWTILRGADSVGGGRGGRLDLLNLLDLLDRAGQG